MSMLAFRIGDNRFYVSKLFSISISKEEYELLKSESIEIPQANDRFKIDIDHLAADILEKYSNKIFSINYAIYATGVLRENLYNGFVEVIKAIQEREQPSPLRVGKVLVSVRDLELSFKTKFYEENKEDLNMSKDEFANIVDEIMGIALRENVDISSKGLGY